MPRLLLLMTLLLTTQLSPAMAACCESAVACESLRASTANTCKPAGRCATVDLLARTTLRLYNDDMRPLTHAQKDLAGNYALNLTAMKLVNDWAVGDAPGIVRPGRSELSVSRICSDGRQVEIAASVFFKRFEIVFDARPATRRAGEREVEGFEARMDGTAYFFSRER